MPIDLLPAYGFLRPFNLEGFFTGALVDEHEAAGAGGTLMLFTGCSHYGPR